jgi:hypothetical protein
MKRLKLEWWIIKADFTYWLHGIIGYKCKRCFIERMPKFQRWLAKIGNWPDSW